LDRVSDPDLADLLAERFSQWLPEQFRPDPTFRSEAGAAALEQI
jgi:hypothetical protein